MMDEKIGKDGQVKIFNVKKISYDGTNMENLIYKVFKGHPLQNPKKQWPLNML